MKYKLLVIIAIIVSITTVNITINQLTRAVSDGQKTNAHCNVNDQKIKCSYNSNGPEGHIKCKSWEDPRGTFDKKCD
jgi:hypothetical protein